MMAYSHQAFGVMTSLLFLDSAKRFGIDLTLTEELVFVTATSIGALLPDFDTPRSKIGRKFPWIFFPVWVLHSILKLLSILPGPLQKILKRMTTMTGHRGFAHYPFTWFLIGIFLLTFHSFLIFLPGRIELILILALLFGALTHLVGDAVFGGISLLAPFSLKRFRLSSFHTGGLIEKLVFLLCVVISIHTASSLIQFSLNFY